MESSCFPSLAIRAAASASAPGKSSKGNCTGTAVSSTDAAALRSSTLSEVAARAGHLFWREQPPGCLQLSHSLRWKPDAVKEGAIGAAIDNVNSTPFRVKLK